MTYATQDLYELPGELYDVETTQADIETWEDEKKRAVETTQADIETWEDEKKRAESL